MRTSRLELAALAAILLLAGVLRLGWPGVNSFAFDEARLSLIALRMVHGQEFAALGMPSSTGAPNLPAAAWVFALPYALSSDPLVATLFVGVLSLGAVLGVWALARAAWGSWAGLVAALFLAASPYGALYARNIWSQDLLPPLAVAWLIATGRAVTPTGQPPRRWAIALTAFLAGAAFQVHPAGGALILASVGLVVWHRWYRRPFTGAPLALAIGAGLAALMLLPPAIQIACCSREVIDQYRDVAGDPSRLDLLAVQRLVELGLGRGWSFLALGARDTVSGGWLPAAGAGLLLVIGVSALLRMLTARSQDSRARLLAGHTLLLLTAAPILFLRHSFPVNAHYLLPGLPALALVAGASTRLVTRRAWGPLLLAVTALVAGVWASQVARSLDRAGTIETPGGLGTPLSVQRDAARAVPDDLPVLFFTHGDDPDVDGEAAVFAVLWWGRDHRIVQGESVLILPDVPSTLMATLAPFQAWEELVDSGLASQVQTLNRREGVLPYVLTRYDGVQAPEGFTPIDPPLLLANGAQLEGWRVRQVGPRMRISTLWRVMETPPPGVMRQFHHLRTAETLDPATPPPFGSDVPLSSHNWRPGDRVIVMGDFVPDAAGEFWVDVGHYTLADVRRFARADGEGDSVRLGPFTWDGGE